MLDNHNDEEYWKRLIELQDNSEYVNEIEPAYAFYDYAPEYLRLNFVDIQKNEKDPPDFFLKLKKDNLINLEVTSLANELIFKTNKFIKKLKEIKAMGLEEWINRGKPHHYWDEED